MYSSWTYRQDDDNQLRVRLRLLEGITRSRLERGLDAVKHAAFIGVEVEDGRAVVFDRTV